LPAVTLETVPEHGPESVVEVDSNAVISIGATVNRPLGKVIVADEFAPTDCSPVRIAKGKNPAPVPPGKRCSSFVATANDWAGQLIKGSVDKAYVHPLAVVAIFYSPKLTFQGLLRLPK
jgi:hypothetical protein